MEKVEEHQKGPRGRRAVRGDPGERGCPLGRHLSTGCRCDGRARPRQGLLGEGWDFILHSAGLPRLDLSGREGPRRPHARGGDGPVWRPGPLVFLVRGYTGHTPGVQTAGPWVNCPRRGRWVVRASLNVWRSLLCSHGGGGAEGSLSLRPQPHLFLFC